MDRYTAKKEDLSKDRAPISLRQTLKIARENCGYSLDDISAQAEIKNIKYFGETSGLSNQNISEIEKGMSGLRHRILEKLSVIYEVPAGVLLLISRAVAEAKHGDKQNLQALIKGLEGLIALIKKQIEDIDKNPSDYPNKNYDKSDEFAHDIINAYKYNMGLQGIGPDFINRVEEESTTSS